MKKLKYIFVVLFVCVFAYFILGEFFLPADDLGEIGRMKKYSREWERILPNGDRVPQEVPGRCDAEKNEVVIVETTLPKMIPEDMYLCFRSAKQDMEIYVDGELRQTYSTKDTRLFGNVSAAAYLFLQVYSEDAGKVLRLKTQTDSSYSGIFYSVYVGNRMEIWVTLFRQYGLELSIAFLVLIFSAISIFGSILIRLRYRRRISLEYLAWGVLMASVWLIANSVLRQMFFPNLSVINDMAFCMIMLLPIPFLFFSHVIQRGRYEKGDRIAVTVAILNFVLCSGLHMTGLCDFTDTIFYLAVVSILVIVYMFVTIFIDAYKGFIKEYIFVAIGIICVFLAAVFQFVMYFQRTNLFSGVVLSGGLIALLLFAVLHTVR